MEFLRSILGEELFKQLEEKLKGNDKVKLANLADGEYVAKAKFTSLEDSNKELKTQIDDREKQLADLKKTAGSSEELKAKITELEAANKTAKEDYEGKLLKQTFDFSLDSKLTSNKVKNPKAVKALLDLEKITLDGDKLLGLEDQLTALKTSDSYLFEVAGDTGGGGNPGDTKPPAGELSADEVSAIWGGTPPTK